MNLKMRSATYISQMLLNPNNSMCIYKFLPSRDPTHFKMKITSVMEIYALKVNLSITPKTMPQKGNVYFYEHNLSHESYIGLINLS